MYWNDVHIGKKVEWCIGKKLLRIPYSYTEKWRIVLLVLRLLESQSDFEIINSYKSYPNISNSQRCVWTILIARNRRQEHTLHSWQRTLNWVTSHCDVAHCGWEELHHFLPILLRGMLSLFSIIYDQGCDLCIFFVRIRRFFLTWDTNDILMLR